MAKILLENSKYSLSDLKILLNKLLLCQYVHIRKETLWLIGNNNKNVVIKLNLFGITNLNEKLNVLQK